MELNKSTCGDTLPENNPYLASALHLKNVLKYNSLIPEEFNRVARFNCKEVKRSLLFYLINNRERVINNWFKIKFADSGGQAMRKREADKLFNDAINSISSAFDSILLVLEKNNSIPVEELQRTISDQCGSSIKIMSDTILTLMTSGFTLNFVDIHTKVNSAIMRPLLVPFMFSRSS